MPRTTACTFRRTNASRSGSKQSWTDTLRPVVKISSMSARPDGSPDILAKPTHAPPVPRSAPNLPATPQQGQAPLVTLGDITVTQTTVITPVGTLPLEKAQFTFSDLSRTVRVTPAWAIVLAIIGFFFFLLGLFFSWPRRSGPPAGCRYSSRVRVSCIRIPPMYTVRPLCGTSPVGSITLSPWRPPLPIADCPSARSHRRARAVAGPC